MNEKEHRLMMMMFAMHLGMMGELINVLRENKVLKDGDLSQIWNVALQNAGKREIFSAISGMYKEAAATCGVDIGSQP
ncbi:MAG TPA: hypothetical protein VL128_16195 [Candidatus Eisenbacteria bacterium]|nr:hypothetical protein [Candidatus Eisenbacteria bacterium]